MTCQNESFPLKRGASFHVLIRIPSAFPDGHFVGWTLQSQARTEEDELLADLEASWEDPLTTRVLVLKCLDTNAWIVGPAQFDVKLTAPDGFVLPTDTAIFYVLRGATHA